MQAYEANHRSQRIPEGDIKMLDHATQHTLKTNSNVHHQHNTLS